MQGRVFVVDSVDLGPFREQVCLNFDSAPGMSVGAISITDEVAQSLLDRTDSNLKELQDQLDTGQGGRGLAGPREGSFGYWSRSRPARRQS